MKTNLSLEGGMMLCLSGYVIRKQPGELYDASVCLADTDTWFAKDKTHNLGRIQGVHQAMIRLKKKKSYL